MGLKDVGIEEYVSGGKFSTLLYDSMCDGKKWNKRTLQTVLRRVKFLDVIKFREILSLCLGNSIKNVNISCGQNIVLFKSKSFYYL